MLGNSCRAYGSGCVSVPHLATSAHVATSFLPPNDCVGTNACTEAYAKPNYETIGNATSYQLTQERVLTDFSLMSSNVDDLGASVRTQSMAWGDYDK